MANEIVEKDRLKSSAMLIASNEVMRRIKNYASETELEFTPNAKKCVDSALSKINDMLVIENQNWGFFNTAQGIDNLFSTLKYIAFMELNVANSEVAITFRNVKTKDGQSNRVLETKIQGAGNDRVLRRFGEGVVDVKSYLVYEGDEFTPPYMDGFNYVLPKYQPRYKTEKVLYAVYLIKLNTGYIDVSIATREDVKVSLLAHINQNMRFNKAFTTELQTKLENMGIDEILYNEEYSKMVIGGTRLISPAWGDFAKERMIARKIRNHALRKWSHNLNFGKKELHDIYEEGFEEELYNRPEKNPTLIIESHEAEFDNKNSTIEVDLVGQNVGKEVVIQDEPQSQTVQEPQAMKVEFEINGAKEETPPPSDDVPDWAKDLV